MAITLRGVSAALGTGTTSVSVAAPAGIANNDVMIAFIVDAATSGSSAAPTGWVRVTGASGTSGRSQMFLGVFGRNSIGSSPWSFTGLTTICCGAMIAYSGVEPSTVRAIDGSASRRNASGTTGCTAITPGNNKAEIVAAFCSHVNGSTWSAEAVATAPTLTERFDAANGTSQSIAIADGNLTTRASTGASSATMGTAGINAGLLIGLRPLVPGIEDVTNQGDLTIPFVWLMGNLKMVEMEDTQQQLIYATAEAQLPLDESYQQQWICLQTAYIREIEVEQENWGWKPPTPPTTRDEVYYENPPLQMTIVPEMEVEAESFGINVLAGGGIQLGGFRGFWSLKAGMGSEDIPEFNIAVVAAVITPFDSEENPAMGTWQVLDSSDPDFGFQTPGAGGGTQMGAFRGWTLKAGMFEDSMIYEAAEAQNPTDESNYDFLASKQWSIPELNAEIEWIAYPSPGAGTGSQLGGFRGFWSLKAGMGSDLQDFGFSPPVVVTAISAFDDDQSLWCGVWRTAEDELFAMDLPVIVDVDVQPLAAYVVIGHDETQGIEIPFSLDVDVQPLITEPLDVDEQMGLDNPFISIDADTPMMQAWAVQDEDQSLRGTPFLQTIALGWEQEAMGAALPQPVTPEDEAFGFTPFVLRMPFDSEENPAQQTSFYFNADDLEKFNWGWMPPMAKVSEDEAPYDFITPPPIKVDVDESFGFKLPPVSDDAFDYAMKGMTVDADEVFGFNQPVVTVNLPWDTEFNGEWQFQVATDSDDSFGLQIGISSSMMDEQSPEPVMLSVDTVEDFGVGVPFSQETETVIPTISNVLYDEDQIVFLQPAFLSVDSGVEQQIPVSPLTWQEDEQYGFQIPPIRLGWDSEENPPQMQSFYWDSLELEQTAWEFIIIPIPLIRFYDLTIAASTVVTSLRVAASNAIYQLSIRSVQQNVEETFSEYGVGGYGFGGYGGSTTVINGLTLGPQITLHSVTTAPQIVLGAILVQTSEELNI